MSKIKWSTLTHISVIGDGGWGTTLAIHLAKKGYQVKLWGAFDDYVTSMRRLRTNKKFLPGIKFPKSLTVTADLNEAIAYSPIIVLAVPSQFITSVLNQIKSQQYKGRIFISATKGIQLNNFKTTSQLIQSILGKVDVAVLSGPTIASEVAKGIPSTAVAASTNKNIAKHVQQLFHTPNFRIYTNTDVLGVEVAGSIKNVIAIACGICDGLGYGTNAKAALLTRGLAEMARLGHALGAKPKTFIGLAGLGDLATTCFSPSSRNRSVGELLGKGKTIAQILKNMHMVAEGVETAKSVHQLSKKLKITMPLTEAVYQIIFNQRKPKDVVAKLLERDPREE